MSTPSRAVGKNFRSIATSISYNVYVLPPAYAIRQDSRGGGVNMALCFRTGGVVCAENRSTIRQRTVAAVYDILIQNHIF